MPCLTAIQGIPKYARTRVRQDVPHALNNTKVLFCFCVFGKYANYGMKHGSWVTKAAAQPNIAQLASILQTSLSCKQYVVAHSMTRHAPEL